jgi:hypothetical protein
MVPQDACPLESFFSLNMPSGNEASFLEDYSGFNADYTLCPLEDFESLDRKTKSTFLKLIKHFGKFVTKDNF